MSERTAPAAYGRIQLVCGGEKDWCGQTNTAHVEVDPGEAGRGSFLVRCRKCGKVQTITIEVGRER